MYLNGMIPLFQVYGVFIKYLSQLPEAIRNRLLHLLYDDNCHLARFTLRKGLISPNEVTKMFSDIKKSIDKFHFSNHVDKWCIDNCDPYSHPELTNVNTVICEQLFRDVNEHKNCKSMNEARYFLFWLYILDLYNLEVEGMAGCTPDPRSDFRWANIKLKEVDLTNVTKMVTEVDEMAEIKVGEKQLLCKSCGANYSTEGYLERHMTDKHKKESKLFKCQECDKILSSVRNLENHVVAMHRNCKLCNKNVKNNEDLMFHKKDHTTCNVCGGYFTTKYGLGRHLKLQH